jgi:hypothetical protein
MAISAPEQGRELAYFDGLNRFYVHASKRESNKVLRLSIHDLDFDEHLLLRNAGSGKLRTEQDGNAKRDTRLQGLRSVIVMQDAVIQGLASDIRTEPEAANLRLDALAAEFDLSKRELASVYASTSWKLTRPLRFASGAVRSVVAHLIPPRKHPASRSVETTTPGRLEPLSPTIWAIGADPDVLSDWEKIGYEASHKISGTRQR